MIKLTNIFSVVNHDNKDVQHKVFTQGIPCPQGLILVAMNLSLVDEKGVSIPAAFEPIAFWPDNSVKWFHVHSVISVDANSTRLFSLHQQSLPTKICPTIIEQVSPHDMIVHGKHHQVTLNSIGIKHSQFSIDFQLDMLGFQANDFKITSIKEYQAQTPLYCDVTCEFTGQVPQGNVHHTCHIRIVYASSDVYVESILHNPQPASHPNGTWDLGDPNSIMVEHWGARLRFVAPNTVSTHLIPHEQSIGGNELTIEQLSSGGEHWDSDAHIAADMSIPLTEAGVLINGQPTSFTRVSPCIEIQSAQHHCFARLDQFWEKFPSTLHITPHDISFGFHSNKVAPLNELQPGERWERTLQILAEPINAHDAIDIQLDPQYVSSTLAIDTFGMGQINSPLQTLLDQGLEGAADFFTKREQADLYGFRHFGEVYADHEAAGHTGDKAFISVYNNQYDPLLGFIKQSILTQDPRYQRLAKDLAHHVMHIDIYHTQQDKPEYNGGLFWHTDHYLPALSSTHRTYSQHHQADAYEDHAGGGGPGGQHCYSTGLLYYYFLTGNRHAKEAVTSLYHWIEHVYDGDRSLVGFLLAFKNRHRIDLKNIVTNTYPLDRGTANYINATIDMFMLHNDQYYLHKVFAIIVNTVSPQDELTERGLLEVEQHWFYTVFLQAVCRFMRVLRHYESDTQQHEMWLHCQKIIVLFADWMVEHERPYLTKPDILEYPNQTWTGQDLRKVDVLAFAAMVEPEKRDAYQAKANELQSYIVSQLSVSEELPFARIQSLIMQNYGGIDLYEQNDKILPLAFSPSQKCSGANTIEVSKFSGFTQMAVENLRDWSITHEIRQLKKRSQRLNKWIN